MTRKAVETGALWKPWKNGDIKQTTLGVEFFHRSHNAWETPPDGVSHRFYDEIHPPKNETPRLQKCNLCAREKLLPMNQELQGKVLLDLRKELSGEQVRSAGCPRMGRLGDNCVEATIGELQSSTRIAEMDLQTRICQRIIVTAIGHPLVRPDNFGLNLTTRISSTEAEMSWTVTPAPSPTTRSDRVLGRAAIGRSDSQRATA